jgi:hypothetical protein
MIGAAFYLNGRNHMTQDMILLLVQLAIKTGQQAYDAFTRIHGRAPTAEEWQGLFTSWKSPDQIEQEVRAALSK